MQIPLTANTARGQKASGEIFPAVQKQYKKLGILRKLLDYKEIVLAPQVKAKRQSTPVHPCSPVFVIVSVINSLSIIYDHFSSKPVHSRPGPALTI
jgi:hypothetical protein